MAALAAGACVLALVRAWSVVAIARAGGNQFQDDAFYYLVIARNLVADGRLTFDGVHVTNGFHPLWFAVVAVVQASLGAHADPGRVVVAISCVEQLLYVGAVALAGACAIRAARRGDPAAAGLLLVAWLYASPLAWVMRQGMETTLAALLLVALLVATTAGRARTQGVLLALLCLARLDTAVFVALPWIAWAGWRARSWRACATLAWPVVVVVALDTTFNLALTGHAVPISGALKSAFPWPRWQPGFLAEPLIIARSAGWATLVASWNLVLLAAVVVATPLLLAGRIGTRGARHGLAPAWIAALALTLNLVLFQRWDKSIDPRYFVLPGTAALFVLGTVAVARGRAGYALTGALLAALVAWSVAGAWAMAHAAREPDPLTRLMRDIGTALPADAVVAGTDTGALGFWTGRRVVNLDGVVNDWAYQDALREGRLGAWLAAAGVTHVASGLWDRAPAYTGRPVEPMYRQGVDPAAESGAYATHRFYVHAYRYGVDSDAITLRRDREVFRRELPGDGWNRTAFVIWRWP
ncbi:MAG: hypothetical protein JSR18_01815 [Proteobacteria bacterium]|nr:hypothetical protein [Pseudomonadota bacterium]